MQTKTQQHMMSEVKITESIPPTISPIFLPSSPVYTRI